MEELQWKRCFMVVEGNLFSSKVW